MFFTKGYTKTNLLYSERLLDYEACPKSKDRLRSTASGDPPLLGSHMHLIAII